MKVKLPELCRQKKISLYKLAKMLGNPHQTIYSWVNGRTQISYINIERLCVIFNCGISDILEPELTKECENE